VVLLNVELAANDLTLAQAQEQLYRFGRGYPAGWNVRGQPLHTMASVEWLDAHGAVLARSDSQQRDLFMAHVAEHRAPRTAAHWAFMLKPLVSDHSDEPGELRYRQIEYYRMPMMAYLAVDEPALRRPGPQTLRDAVVEPFREFIRRDGWRGALLVLLFIFLYKLGDSMATALATPFYLDMGFTKSEIGLIAKNAGLWASVAGGMLGGLWMLRLGINRGLWLFGVV